MLSNFKCLDDSKRKTITFANNASKKVDILPTIRIMQAAWTSQYSTHFAAAMFMREYLGMNAKHKYNAIW